MTAHILDGKKLALEIEQQIACEVNESNFSIKPKLAVILVGENSASQLYVEKKQLACVRVGFETQKFELPSSISEQEVLVLIQKLNQDSSIHGILVQLPLPAQLSTEHVMNAILPIKDVDGFSSHNIGLLAHGNEFLLSATARSVLRLLETIPLDFKGKHFVIVGHTLVVARPLGFALVARDATVTITNKFTQNLSDLTQKADVIVSAVGKPSLITNEMVKENVIAVDVGISRVNNKVVGDLDFENLKEKASYITPVPGGVGPVTVSCLLENTWNSFKVQMQL